AAGLQHGPTAQLAGQSYASRVRQEHASVTIYHPKPLLASGPMNGGRSKDLDNRFSNTTTSTTLAVKNSRERYKFVLGAYNGGPTRVADTQRRAEKTGTDPRLWTNVEKFLESENTKKSIADQMRQYVEKVPLYEAEFARKSPANKRIKLKKPRKERYSCADGHWVTIDDRPVFICD
ncbi:MAG: hypothetical protein Q8R91_02015, partial [Candidatus Omnitrophota bacterium]|nr:hypothetical protein [Candidatus Omnitrophota bacterium]